MILQGDALAILRTLPDASVNCCITSPPYYGLRDYGCACQIGLESTPAEYIIRLVDVFREVQRVLRDDGTLWVNIGDSYTSGGRIWRATDKKNPIRAMQVRPPTPDGLKPKDLIGVPWMLAFALRDDGWYLRQDIIWHKPNPMPESVKDRCTKAHEYVFLLSKSARYWCDMDAVAEPALNTPGGRLTRAAMRANGLSVLPSRTKSQPGNAQEGRGLEGNGLPETRNKRSVWTLATLPTPEAHFATFPIELPETCLRAGCPEGGMVLDPFCGAGTTGLACLKNGREFVGIELKAEYVAIAEARARKYYPLLAGATA